MVFEALLLLAALAAAPSNEIIVTAPSPGPLHAAKVPDRALATMRGGVRLPNGLDLSLGIDIQTRIDGMLALHTVYASEGSQPGVRVFTDGAKPVPTAPTTQTLTSQAIAGVPLLIVDRSPSGTTIVPANAVAAATVNLVNGDQATWLSGDGQTQIPVVANGPPVDATPGQVRLNVDASGAVVTLKTPTLEVRQLIGQATGVVVANAGNDRTIDTISAVNVDLRGVSPALLQGAFMAQRAALDALVGR